jgi:hypothetical protein
MSERGGGGGGDEKGMANYFLPKTNVFWNL